MMMTTSNFSCAGVTVATVKSDFPLSPRNGTYIFHNQSQVHGKKIFINGKEIALFCYKDTFYALDEKCPHLGMYISTGTFVCLCYFVTGVFVLLFSLNNTVLPA